jgi:RNA-directed DNA polymerase
MAKSNDGAPGIDGVVTFEAVEESGVENFLKQIRDELVNNTYRPLPAREKGIPKDGGKKVRVLSIPAMRDRVVRGIALRFAILTLSLKPYYVPCYGS